EFLEVAIHYILYIRSVYPAELFSPRRKYNVPVRMSRHPVLNGYIRDVLSGLTPDLQRGTVSKLYLVIHDPRTKQPYEKFTFQIRTLTEGLSESMLKNAESSIGVGDVERHLRAFLLKISVCDALLAPNPPDAAFAILVELSEEAKGPVNELAKAAPWIPSDPGQVDVSAAAIVPLKTMDAGILKMQLYVEESAEKGEARDVDLGSGSGG
ncbi:MAD2 mitotic arrest deficient-like 2, partial [Fimicolochytrium jonesii]|uniref:MAD2 mitotic arrest deficient-like 2 n=1 Tax=Fimicolochytrium jonesii TaxID=1396493 RepID=UPI0022FE8A28